MKASLRVRLLRYTPEPEKTVALAARMCYSAASFDDILSASSKHDPGGDAKFLAGLLASNHLSPLEHASFTFLVGGVSRALLAQLTRHRIASFSVQSQRYVNARGMGYVVPQRVQELGGEAVTRYGEQMDTIASFYEEWIDKLGESGKEDARFVLPNAAPTQLIMTMNARELLHFFSLRCCNRAQWEIRALALSMLAYAKAVAPALFKKAGPGCVYGACPEGRMSCGRAEEVRKRLERLAEVNTEDEAAVLAWAESI